MTHTQHAHPDTHIQHTHTRRHAHRYTHTLIQKHTHTRTHHTYCTQFARARRDYSVGHSCLSFFAVPSDRTVVSKERAAGSYRLSAYFFAKTCSEDPMNLVPPLFFIAILFPIAGLSGWGAFFGTISAIILMMFMSQVSASDWLEKGAVSGFSVHVL